MYELMPFCISIGQGNLSVVTHFVAIVPRAIRSRFDDVEGPAHGCAAVTGGALIIQSLSPDLPINKFSGF